MSAAASDNCLDGLAVTRERRANAGARMSKLLQAEDEDEFYQTTYGGFAEEEDDNDYRSEDSASEGTDSDIDIDENDEVKSDGEDEGGAKRTKRLVTKAYQEPKAAATCESKPAVPRSKALADPPRPKKIEVIDASLASPEKKALRASTAEKSRSTEDTTKEREAKAAMLRAIADRKKVASVRRLTQEELLAEAMVTEQINLRSLEMYQRLELEKKRSKVHRPVQRGPMIRYRSTIVPLDPVLVPVPSSGEALVPPLVPPTGVEVKKEEGDVDVDSKDVAQRDIDSANTTTTPTPAPPVPKCSRNLISFTDETLFRQYFPWAPRGGGGGRPVNPPTPPKKQFCVVTGLPAKYFDPVTQSPYATTDAFKILREEHSQRMAAVRAEGAESMDGIKRRSRTLTSTSSMMSME